ARVVVLNANRVRSFRRAIVRPAQIAGQDILWALQPFKTDYRRRCGTRLAIFYAAPCEAINEITSNGSLSFFRPRTLCYAVPRVRHVTIKFFWIKAVN